MRGHAPPALRRRTEPVTASPAPPAQRAAVSERAAPLGHDISRVPLAAPVQRQAAPGAAAGGAPLPSRLRAGIEHLSGYDMSDVRVHRNSPKPARVDALAYAQGRDIHLAAGQEKHLPHEAWHVVQQKQGRVRATLDVAGARINDDAGLEGEAERLGAASAVYGRPSAAEHTAPSIVRPTVLPQNGADRPCIQRLRLKKNKQQQPPKKIRPNFPRSAYKLAAIAHSIQTGMDPSKIKPGKMNLAMPHRFPYAAIQAGVEAFITRREKSEDLIRWSDRLLVATQKRLEFNLPYVSSKYANYYEKTIEKQIEEFVGVRDELIEMVEDKEDLRLHSSIVRRFINITNALHGNIPDFGPHKGVNIQVSNRLHLHFNRDGTITPGSYAAGNMTPSRVPKGIAYTSNNKYMITTDGEKISHDDFIKLFSAQISNAKSHQFIIGTTSIDSANLRDFRT